MLPNGEPLPVQAVLSSKQRQLTFNDRIRRQLLQEASRFVRVKVEVQSLDNLSARLFSL